MEQDPTEPAFDALVRTDGERLRKVMSSQCGVDIGCESSDAAVACAWQHFDRLRAMSNPAGHLYRVAQTQARRAIGRSHPSPSQLNRRAVPTRHRRSTETSPMRSASCRTINASRC